MKMSVFYIIKYFSPKGVVGVGGCAGCEGGRVGGCEGGREAGCDGRAGVTVCCWCMSAG